MKYLQEQASPAFPETGLKLRPVHYSSVNHVNQNLAISRPYFHGFYNAARRDTMRDINEDVHSIDNYYGTMSPFFRLVQIFSEAAATYLKSTALVANPLRAILPPAL